MGMIEHVRWSRLSLFTGLFEVRAAEYLASCPEPEPSGVNRFLKGLGKPLASPLPKKGNHLYYLFPRSDSLLCFQGTK